MKTFLILTSKSERTASWAEREIYVRQFAEKLESELEGIKVLYSTYEDMDYSIKGGQISIYDAFNKRDLKQVDLLHFKNWSYEPQEAALIARYLEWHGVPYLNSEVNNGLATSKISQMMILAHADVRVPMTFYARRQRLAETFKKGLPRDLDYPFIMKANDGSKGDDNYLIKSADQALSVLARYDGTEKQFVLQEYLPNDGDYRLLYIGLDEEPLIFKRLAAAGSHLNNTSKGGSGELVEVGRFSPGLLKLAERAARTLKREVGGVDILIDKRTAKGYVLEVNGTPALATGYALDKKLDRFTTFLENVLEVQEEE